MKDVPKKHLPEVSGGQYQDGGCIPPFGDFPSPDYPSNPGGPGGVPLLDTSETQT